MKVRVDESLCSGCGLCADLCPEVFEINENNISAVKVNPVPTEHESATKEAAESCPDNAIIIE